MKQEEKKPSDDVIVSVATNSLKLNHINAERQVVEADHKTLQVRQLPMINVAEMLSSIVPPNDAHMS